MHRTPVQSSSIKAVGFDRHHHTLVIEFLHGGTYEYAEVPEHVFHELLHAESKGRYFLEHIRDNFSYVRVGEVDLADVRAEEREDALLADEVETFDEDDARAARAAGSTGSTGAAGAAGEPGASVAADGPHLSRHVWVVDVLGDDSAVISVDGRQVTNVPRWMLPPMANEGDALAISHERHGGRSVLDIRVDREGTRRLYEQGSGESGAGSRSD